MKAWHVATRSAMHVILTSCILLAALALLGMLMMPQWTPEPYTDHINVATGDTAIASAVATTDHEGAYRTRTRDITIRLDDGGSVRAVLREPIDAPGQRPACLFIHGSGTGSADDFGDIANAMSSAGIITLVPAKRTTDYTPFHRDYQRFALDYGTALDLLKMIPGVDAAHTGLYAESEGTWISMLMTQRRPDVAFSILSSAPVYKGREQMAMAASAYMRQVGAPKPVVKDIAKLMSLDYAPFDLHYADFDADDARDSLTMPVLVNYGIHDTAMPIEQGARTIIDDAASHGNRNVTVRYYDANHQMRAGTGLFTPGLPLADGYTHALSDWVNAVAAGTDADGWATPRIAGAQPRQQYTVPQHTESGIIGSLGILVAITILSLACFATTIAGGLFFLLAEAARRRRFARARANGYGTRGHGGDARGDGGNGVTGGRFPAVDRRRRRAHGTNGAGANGANAAWPGTSRAYVRNVGYSRPLATMLAIGVTAATLMLLALAAYIAYAGVAALYEWCSPAALGSGFDALRVGGVICVTLCAWLIVRLAYAWRLRRAYLTHGIYPTAGLHSTWLVGRWHWIVAMLALAGMLLALVVMAFWGLFTL